MRPADGPRVTSGGGRARSLAVPFHLVAATVAALFLLPLVLMLSGSLRPLGLPPPRAVEWVAGRLAWENYAHLFELLPFARYLLNSLLVVAIAIPLTLVSASWAGLAMTLVSPRRRRWLVLLSVAMLMVPMTVFWLTRYVLFAAVGLIDTLAAIIAPSLLGSSPLFVLLYHWAFRRVPGELWDSARLDGAGTLTLWRRIALPLARSTTVAVAVLAFLLYWSDFIDPLLFLKSPELYTLPLGVRQLQQLDPNAWPLLLAGSALLALPAIAVFLLAQRALVRQGPLADADLDR